MKVVCKWLSALMVNVNNEKHTNKLIVYSFIYICSFKQQYKTHSSAI